MLFSSRNYAIGMAHYQMAGGHRALLVLLAGYAALAMVILGLIVHLNSGWELAEALRATAVFLLVAETFGLVFFGSARVANCIRVDTVSNMIESHRLMPISTARVVLSYLFGTTSQLLLLLAANALVLAGVEAAAHVPLDQFITSQIVLAFFAVFSWTWMAMGAFMFRQALPLMIVGFIFGGMTTALLRQLGILPAVSIVMSPFLGETIYNLTGGGVSFRALYFIAIPSQMAFAALFFIGACRRYRGNYLTTFNVGMGVVLVSLWGAVSVFSIFAWPEVLRALRFPPDQPDVPAQVVAALAVGMVLMLVPLHATATWEAARGLRPAARWGALAAIILAALIPVFASPAANPIALAACIVALHAVTFFSAFRLTRGMGALGAGVIVVGLLLVLWLGPFMLEVVRLILSPPTQNSQGFSVLSTFSPLGLLMRAWETVDGRPPMVPGLVFQVVVAALAWTAGSRRLAKSMPVDAKPLATPAA